MKLKSKGRWDGEERWAETIGLGVRTESGEIFVGTADGVVTART